MAKLGKRSMERLSTCHPDLIRVAQEAIKKGPDFTVLCGQRSREDQDKAVEDGMSKAEWPESCHNTEPSCAMDLAPWPIDWHDTGRFKLLAGYILATAHQMGVPLRWGGDWDRDYDLDDQRFVDMPHFELDTPATVRACRAAAVAQEDRE